jgi:hypothetical protein
MACNIGMHHKLAIVLLFNIFDMLCYGINIEICKAKSDRRMSMQKLFKSIENLMVAITFAESGEYDEARKIAGQEHEDEAVNLSTGSDLKSATKA